MKLGKRKTARTVGNVRTVSAPSLRQFHRPNPLRVGRFSGQLPRRQARMTCKSQDCEDRILTPEGGIVRVQLGFVTYDKYVRFTEAFPVTPGGDTESFLHATCAMEGGMRIQSLKLDKCCLCDRQFFCHEEPKECCVFIQHGHIEGDEFITIREGAVHWPCADWHWGGDITVAWRGPYASK